MEINGIAHIQLTVTDFASSVAFYEKLLPFLGLTPVMSMDGFYYCVGGRTGVAISQADEEHRDERFVQRRVGLHHVCFRARERADVDAVHAFLVELGAKIVHPPEDGAWAPGYYSLLFEDPDGIRLEINHVPGKGLLVLFRSPSTRRPGAKRPGLTELDRHPEKGHRASGCRLRPEGERPFSASFLAEACSL